MPARRWDRVAMANGEAASVTWSIEGAQQGHRGTLDELAKPPVARANEDKLND
jgi:hypothetical protein